MGRAASAVAYRRLLEDLKNELSGIGLGADIIVGFPGETNGHFLRTYRFLEEMPLSYIHVFPFSPRPGTAATTFPHAPSPQEKRERTHQLRSLSREKASLFRSSFIGKRLPVIVLRKKDAQGKGCWALSDNYVPILIQDAVEEMVGQLIPVEIEEMNQGVLLGRWKE
jgi:threonylcarbamoyladenosine tRNA methylthiotransferase MtaB